MRVSTRADTKALTPCPALSAWVHSRVVENEPEERVDAE